MRRRSAARQRRTYRRDDRVYRDIDRLAAAGLIDTLIVGTRPFSEREVVRLLGEARRNLDRNPSARAWAERAIDIDLAHFTRLTTRVIDAATAEVVGLDSPYRGIPSDANGVVDAVINPLAANRGGRPMADGVTASLETWHSATLGSHVAVMLNPRATAWSIRGGDERIQRSVAIGDGESAVRQSRDRCGRDYTIFGQSPTGGLLFSDNAPTLDMVRISNDRPAALPWVLRVLGPASASLFVADLGDARQIHPRTKLVGYHIAFLPHPQFEIGVEVLDAMGGRGGQPASFGDRVVDAIPLIDAIFRSGTDFQFSNKMAGHRFSLAHAVVARFRAVRRGRRRRLRHPAAAQRAARGQRIPARRVARMSARVRAPRRSRRISSDRHSVLHAHRLSVVGTRQSCSAIRSGRARSAAI